MEFIKPQMERILFDAEDIIVTSGTGCKTDCITVCGDVCTSHVEKASIM